MFDELDKLKSVGGLEPDYARVGMPCAYAVRYMGQRTASIVASLSPYVTESFPSAVLDIGSGPGSTGLAISLMRTEGAISLTGLEVSEQMRDFATRLDVGRVVRPRYIPYGLDEVCSGAASTLGRFDLVVLSACFPYRYSNWRALLQGLESLMTPDTMIVAIEPEAKKDLLDALRMEAVARGFPCDQFCCHELPMSLKAPGFLPRLRSLGREIGDPFHDGNIWWAGIPNERFLIINPRQSYPFPGLPI